MNQKGIRNPGFDLSNLDIRNANTVYWNLPPAELTEHTVKQGLGHFADSGALAIDTGKFTGRAPQDRFIVQDEITRDAVDWGTINKAMDPAYFDALLEKMKAYAAGKDLYVRDACACADERYKLNVRVVTEYPWASMFTYNMFLRPSEDELRAFEPDWMVMSFPDFKADPQVDHTRQENFAIINFTKKMIIIGGTGYTGEIKKGIFSVLNFVLPHQQNVLSMHCSANMGAAGDTAIFFGLSGTGKTTLSADPNRKLIGDDEHGWTADSVFNFEGGCYAKVIDLSQDGEPQIWKAIRFGALLENVRFKENSRQVDYENRSVTENTRVSYPLYHIANSVEPSVGTSPNHIFFLTCDAFGVLPPIARLTKEQAMFHFISGYTAKVAGTEAGITEPQTAFSACFGAPFMPLHPTRYAEMLGRKMEAQNVNIWLVNTGWTGGPYGVGSRMKLAHTRAMINAALRDELQDVQYREHPIFGLLMPASCPNVPSGVLNPEDTWSSKEAYEEKAFELAAKFVENFRKFEDHASKELKEALPKVRERTY